MVNDLDGDVTIQKQFSMFDTLIKPHRMLMREHERSVGNHNS